MKEKEESVIERKKVSQLQKLTIFFFFEENKLPSKKKTEGFSDIRVRRGGYCLSLFHSFSCASSFLRFINGQPVFVVLLICQF